MVKRTKIAKKLKVKKLKFLKELNYTADVLSGGCGYNHGCTNAM